VNPSPPALRLPRTPGPSGRELLGVDHDPDRTRRATVEIVVPVHDEEADLEASIRRLHSYLATTFPIPWTVTIADNASTDRTWGIACRLAADLDGVNALHLDQKGRGRALREAWTRSTARVVAYMDVDLSTDLDALLPLVAPLVTGHSDVAIGTRLAASSRVVRGPKREAISRAYNLLLKTTLRSGFSDAQCGFKAVRTDVARALLPSVEDQGWFFDTELLVVAERAGLRIHEIPVDWVDDSDSRVDVVGTALADLRGIWRMVRHPRRDEPAPPAGGVVARPAGGVDAPATASLGGQLVRFASIGGVSTILFGALFALLAAPLGFVLADVVALVVCALANTAANRRLTFALHGRSGRARHYGSALVLALLPLALTLLTLFVFAVAGITSMPLTLAGLTAVNMGAALARFVLLRRWVFRPVTPRRGEAVMP
jgi:putative flippase GtrA